MSNPSHFSLSESKCKRCLGMGYINPAPWDTVYECPDCSTGNPLETPISGSGAGDGSPADDPSADAPNPETI